jgi:hypothetical protein
MGLPRHTPRKVPDIKIPIAPLHFDLSLIFAGLIFRNHSKWLRKMFSKNW